MAAAVVLIGTVLMACSGSNVQVPVPTTSTCGGTRLDEAVDTLITCGNVESFLSVKGECRPSHRWAVTLQDVRYQVGLTTPGSDGGDIVTFTDELRGNVVRGADGRLRCAGKLSKGSFEMGISDDLASRLRLGLHRSYPDQFESPETVLSMP